MNIASCIFDGVSGQSIELNTWDLPLLDFETSVSTRRDPRPKVQDHGNWPIKTWMDVRTFHLEGQLLANDTVGYMTKRMSFMGAFTPAPELGFYNVGTLRLLVDGINEEMQALCDIDLMPEIPVVGGFPTSGDYVVDLISPRPMMLGATINKFFTGTPTGGSGGLVFPMTFPIEFSGGSVGGEVNVTNNGNTTSYPIVIFHGPCSTPSATIIVNGVAQRVAFDDIILAAGEYLTVNFDPSSRTAVTSTGGSVYHKVALGSSWWGVPPGTYPVGFSAGSVSVPAEAEIQLRNAYNI